jgi:CBS domain-containing protein
LGVLEKFFLGSVSEYCLKHAECSVMIHKEGSQVHLPGTSSLPRPVSGKELMLLGNVTLSECLGKHKPFIHVESTANAHHIIKALTGNSITAVPVLETSQNKWLGFVDMVDIADYLIQFLKETKTDEQPGSLLARKPLLDIQAHQLFRRDSRSKTFRFLSAEDHLKHALELILEGFERIAVQDQDGKFVGVLSETKIVSFLSSSVDLFDLSQKTVEELQLGYREVISVNQHEPMKVAIEIMLQKNVHGVGVMEGDKLIGNLSVSDLKLAESDEELIQMFFLPVRDVLALQKRALNPFPICVQPQTTVEEVIEKFALTRVHRVYVVTEKEQLMGVITMSDLMSLIFSTFISSPVEKI